MVVATCPRCASVVALHEGRPLITATGTVELWHASCFAIKDVPVAIVEPVVAPIVVVAPAARRSRTRVVVASTAGFAALAIVIASQATAGRGEVSAQVSVEVAIDEATSMRTASSAYEIIPPKPTATSRRLTDKFAMPVDEKDKPLDESYPSLRGWIHPIVDAAELHPNNPGRHFGAQRTGVERAECGDGHCGVDLDGPRGRPLVAVADGVLTTVERRELGADGYSGRYVRIQHDGRTFTSYMHMDQVAAHLQVGNRVTAGQYIGTLGDTAVPNVPHLHFSLEIPNKRGTTRFIDPAPFLVRATIADTAVRKHSVKPAF